MKRRLFIVGCMAAAIGRVAEGAPASNPYAYVYLSRDKDAGWVNLDTAAGYRAFQWLLRDITTGSVGNPPKELGYILSWMQANFRIWGHDVPIVITSGLRLHSTNNATEGAARDSLHLPDRFGVFRAVDIKTPGIPGEYSGRLASMAKLGGVGFYGDTGHTHIDNGRIRYWRKLPRIAQ